MGRKKRIKDAVPTTVYFNKESLDIFYENDRNKSLRIAREISQKAVNMVAESMVNNSFEGNIETLKFTIDCSKA